jgi:phosphate transport system protein
MSEALSTKASVTKLHGLLAKMFDLVDEQLASALNAAFIGDEQLAQSVQEADDKVDMMELEIDRAAREFLAIDTLTDADRRIIITAIKVNTDLERIGDHAKSIAKQVNSEMPLPRDLFEEMADAARAILYDAQDALLQRDQTTARSVLEHERRVSQLYHAAIRSAVSQCQLDSSAAASMAHLIGISKSLERIGDHATNIAESVVFWIEGVDVRHRKLHQGDSIAGTIRLNKPPQKRHLEL